jgi:glycosyltransferase involved in cell wall biosynthesis
MSTAGFMFTYDFDKKRCLVVVARLFSGIEEVIKTGIWEHSGSPAYYNFISKIDKDKDIDCKLIFLSTSPKTNIKDNMIYLKNLAHPVTIVPYYKVPILGKIKLFSIIEIIFNKLIQSARVLSLTKGHHYYYIDRDNFVLAALILLLKKAFVIVRLLGVTDSVFFHLKEKNNLLSLIIRYVFNHDNVRLVCSNDGSYADLVAKDYKEDKFLILFNGVDKKLERKERHSDADIVKIAYLSRVEKNKGHEDFLYALKNLKTKFKYKVLIIGDGSLLNFHKKLSVELGLERIVTFSGKVTHENAISLLEDSDILVSINYDGVFGNNVLEAAQLKIPVIALDHPGCLNSKKETFYILPKENIRDNIAKALGYMIDNANIRDSFSMKSSLFSKECLISWDERINKELDMIKKFYFLKY